MKKGSRVKNLASSKTSKHGVHVHLLALFIPHSKNNFHAYLLRLPALLLFAVLIGLNSFQNIPGSVLGIASNITRDDVVKYTNEQRAKNGLGSLSNNSVLQQAAEAKAADMFKKDYWAHFAPDGTSPWYFFDGAGYKYVFAGENLAKNFNDSSGVVDAWMNSPSHRENILNSKYSEIGIAVMNGKLQGEETTLVVQFFGSPQRDYVASNVTPPTTVAATTRPTLIPSPTPTPIPVAVAEISPSPLPSPEIVAQINNEQLNEQISDASVQGLSFDPSTWVKSFATSSTAQKFNIIALFFVINLFIIDTVILEMRQIRRLHTGHTRYHVIFLISLMIIALTLAKGGIL